MSHVSPDVVKLLPLDWTFSLVFHEAQAPTEPLLRQLWERRRRRTGGVAACKPHRGLGDAHLLDCLSYCDRRFGESAACITCATANNLRKLTVWSNFFFLSGMKRNRFTRKRVEMAERENRTYLGFVASPQAETLAGYLCQRLGAFALLSFYWWNCPHCHIRSP